MDKEHTNQQIHEVHWKLKYLLPQKYWSTEKDQTSQNELQKLNWGLEGGLGS